MPAFPENVSLPVKMLFEASCGTLVVSRFIVIVPVPAAEQAHVEPFHCRTCPLAHEVNRLSVTLPLVPPPAKPTPAVTPVIDPAGPGGPVSTMSNSGG